MSDKVLTQQEKVEKVRELVKDIDFTMLTTVHEDGSLHSRPMSTQQVEFDGDLWFFTNNDTDKVRDIEGTSKVNLSYVGGSSSYVSVSGNAHISNDRAKMKELWSDILKAYFPKGLEDPELRLIHVSVEKAEYWDNPNGTLVTMISFAKSILTGKEADMGENEQVRLN